VLLVLVIHYVHGSPPASCWCPCRTPSAGVFCGQPTPAPSPPAARCPPAATAPPMAAPPLPPPPRPSNRRSSAGPRPPGDTMLRPDTVVMAAWPGIAYGSQDLGCCIELLARCLVLALCQPVYQQHACAPCSATTRARSKRSAPARSKSDASLQQQQPQPQPAGPVPLAPAAPSALAPVGYPVCSSLPATAAMPWQPGCAWGAPVTPMPMGWQPVSCLQLHDACSFAAPLPASSAIAFVSVVMSNTRGHSC
jgi:hypothetical protein